MTLNTWLTQLVMHLTKVFTLNKAQGRTIKLTDKLPQSTQERKMAAREVEYLKCFTHWPTAVAKTGEKIRKTQFFDIKTININEFSSKNLPKNNKVANVEQESVMLKRKVQ